MSKQNVTLSRIHIKQTYGGIDCKINGKEIVTNGISVKIGKMVSCVTLVVPTDSIEIEVDAKLIWHYYKIGDVVQARFDNHIQMIVDEIDE